MKVLAAILLPRQISQFERAYLHKLNRIALVFFAFHVPVFALVAWANHTRPALAALLTAIVFAGPAAAVFTFDNPRRVSVVHGISAMFMGALLVHFGQGPAQIEMHFYFFALLAMCAVFGNPMVIVAATITVALHHVVVWLVLPSSVFNYDAHWWVVAIHALFVVLEAVATCFIARSFFDNVIGLERIVQARTTELASRNRDMRMLLDNIEQGFVVIGRDGRLAEQRSSAIDRWFGAPRTGATWFEYLGTIAPQFEQASRIAWQEVVDDVMPLEVTIDQMPKQFMVGTATYGVVYRPIGEPATLFQVCITDITDHLESEHAVEERREIIALFEHLLADRAGVEAFVEEGTRLVQIIEAVSDIAQLKLGLHTLKGSAAMFGLSTVARRCHELEDLVVDVMPTALQLAPLVERWAFVVKKATKLLGFRHDVVELDQVQLEVLETAARARDTAKMVSEIQLVRLESTRTRFQHIAEQAKQLAAQLGKTDLVVRIESNDVRLEPKRWAGFWQAFVHGVRNAVDHGVEAPDDRAGKPIAGTLILRSYVHADRLVVEIEDDGRGIDWPMVAERARAHALPHSTSQELSAALFVGGLSTARSVTDVSGRGIGMSALLSGTRALGGEIEVSSALGAGTVVRMTFPSADSAVVAS